MKIITFSGIIYLLRHKGIVMASVKILHSADMHIGACESFLGEKSKERQSETLITFENSVRLAQEKCVSVYLIAGDLFDSFNIDFAYIRRVLSIISDYPEIRFVYAAGNHDPYSPASPLREMKLPDNLHIFDTSDSLFTFDDIKTRVYGRSFAEACDKGAPAFSILPPDDEYINILCIHGDLGNTAAEYNPITPAFIEKSCMDYAALGHIHKRTEPAMLGGTYYAYCGCMEGQGFDESGEKGVYIGDVSKHGVNLDFYPLSRRLHVRESVDISGVSTSADAADAVLAFIEEKYGQGHYDNLYRITLKGRVPENADLSAKEIAVRLGEKVYYAKVKDATAPDINLELAAGEPTLKGLFIKNMLARLEAADEEQKPIIEYALNLGLKAFNTGVSFDED